MKDGRYTRAQLQTAISDSRGDGMEAYALRLAAEPVLRAHHTVLIRGGLVIECFHCRDLATRKELDRQFAEGSNATKKLPTK